MTTVRFIRSDGDGSGAANSGLTGPVDFPDPPRPSAPKTPLGLGAAVRTVTGTARVLGLVWRIAPRLTLGIATATVLAGLVPAFTAAVGRTLMNAVVGGIAGRLGARPHPLDVRLPGVTFALPAMSAVSAVVALAVAQFVVYQVSSSATALRNATQQLLQERVSQHMRARIMAHAATMDLRFFEGSRSYDLLRQTQQEAATRPVTIVTGVFGLIQNVITFVSMIVLLLSISPVLAAIVVVAPIPAFIADARYGMRAFLLSTLAAPAKRRMDYLSTLVTTDRNAKEVALFGLGPYFVRRFLAIGRTYYHRQRRLVTSRQAAAAAWTSLGTIAGSATYLYIALRALDGALTLGDLTLYIAASAAVQSSVQGIFQGLSATYENNLYLNQYFELLAVRPDVRAPAEPVGLPATPASSIVFDQVSFRYPESDRFALRKVSFELTPGEVVAVVGPNGSGKSTLMKLICRLYDPDEGRVLVDGVDVRNVDPIALRARIAAMFQDYVTYQATAAENVGLGDVDRIEDRAAIDAAVAMAGARSVVDGLSAGADTMLGKWFGRGTELSGGQWQRLALARAFLRGGGILMLDEPTAALDARAEADLFARMAELSHGRTTVYVSHRFSTVRGADRILVLEDGRLVEQGTHPELMARSGTYAELYELQSAPFRETEPAAD